MQARLIFILVMVCVMASYFGAAFKLPTLGLHDGGW